MDILAIIVLKRYSVRLGTTSLVFNAVLMLTAAARLPLEMVLYTLIYIFVSAYFVNLVVIGLSQRKAVLVISDLWPDISKEIMTTALDSTSDKTLGLGFVAVILPSGGTVKSGGQDAFVAHQHRAHKRAVAGAAL